MNVNLAPSTTIEFVYRTPSSAIIDLNYKPPRQYGFVEVSLLDQLVDGQITRVEKIDDSSWRLTIVLEADVQTVTRAGDNLAVRLVR